ncbi:hypothetical protein BJ508DRAFT_321488 [Ascobolus immersus RN42]|uniref:Uncharacterized protein n=1 Tax=Ascobolus immersus RN42 TaxID=1160509 RepID=A0A3N4IZ47_ASCIM|nr:hypothetical protein BJ508DRAFT_321488 [Ascobolus immersus RN42]
MAKLTPTQQPLLVLLSSPRPSPSPLLEPLSRFLQESQYPPRTAHISLTHYLHTPPNPSVPPYTEGAYDLPAIQDAIDKLVKEGKEDENGSNSQPPELVILEGSPILLLLPLQLPKGFMTIWADSPSDIRLSRAVTLSGVTGGPELEGFLNNWIAEKSGWEAVEGRARERADLIVLCDGVGWKRGIEIVAGAVLDEIEFRRGGAIVASNGRGTTKEDSEYYEMV